MSLWVDIAIIAILALFTFFGFKRGLVGVIFKLFSFVLAIIISLVLYKPVANLIIDHTTVDEKLEVSIVKIIEGKDENTQTQGQNTNEKEAGNTPKVMQNYIDHYVEEAATTAKEGVASAISKDLTKTVIHLCTIVLLFILLNIALFFLRTFSDGITKLPLINQFNKIGGTIYGILEGFLIIFVVFAFISFFVSAASDSALIEAITQSYLGNLLYNHNLLLMFLF